MKKASTISVSNRPKLTDRATVKIARIALIGILVGLGLLMTIIITVVAAAITQNVNENFKATAASNASYIEELLGAADDSYDLVASYLEMSFKAEEEFTGRAGIPQSSRILSSLKLGSFAYEREGVLLNTMWATVSGNDSILGMGILFEKERFAADALDYSIYVSDENAEKQGFQSLGTYSSYSNNDYYRACAQTKSPYMSQPYENGDSSAVTIAYPLIYDREFIGIVRVDLNLSRLNEITSSSSIYTTMQSGILTGDGVVVYDSMNEDFFGQPDSSRYAGDYDLVEEGLATQLAFTARPTGLENDTRVSFYAPVSTAAGLWWTSCSLTWGDLIQTQEQIFVFSIILGALFILGISAIIIFALRRTLSPLTEIMDVLEKLCNGDLNVTLDIRTKDEIGILAGQFTRLVEHQKKLIGDVVARLDRLSNGDFTDTPVEEGIYTGYYANILSARQRIIYNMGGALRRVDESAAQVASGADQVSDAAINLSQSSVKQASSVQELAATIIDCTNDIQDIAKNAHDARGITADSGTGINECSRFMVHLTEAMEDISRTSGEIGNIIKTIDDIAFQTNILALNAAVEAARAGAAGKGFAVVADEVRSLAQKSAEAAQSTTDLIEKTIAAINNGTQLAEDTAAALNAVVEKTALVTQRVEDIADASQRQYESMSQLSCGVEAISQAVQDNSATSEETAAASEELNAQAQIMHEQVRAFRFS